MAQNSMMAATVLERASEDGELDVADVQMFLNALVAPEDHNQVLDWMMRQVLQFRDLKVLNEHSPRMTLKKALEAVDAKPQHTAVTH